MARVTKEMTMGELLQTYYEQCPEIVDVLTGLGMHCIGCPTTTMTSPFFTSRLTSSKMT